MSGKLETFAPPLGEPKFAQGRWLLWLAQITAALTGLRTAISIFGIDIKLSIARYYIAYGYENCHLVKCEWTAPSAVFLGLLSLVMLAIYYFKWGRRIHHSKAHWIWYFSIAYLAASSFLHGLGLVGPKPCPEFEFWDPNCFGANLH